MFSPIFTLFFILLYMHELPSGKFASYKKWFEIKCDRIWMKGGRQIFVIKFFLCLLYCCCNDLTLNFFFIYSVTMKTKYYLWDFSRFCCCFQAVGWRLMHTRLLLPWTRLNCAEESTLKVYGASIDHFGWMMTQKFDSVRVLKFNLLPFNWN